MYSELDGLFAEVAFHPQMMQIRLSYAEGQILDIVEQLRLPVSSEETMLL